MLNGFRGGTARLMYVHHVNWVSVSTQGPRPKSLSLSICQRAHHPSVSANSPGVEMDQEFPVCVYWACPYIGSVKSTAVTFSM